MDLEEIRMRIGAVLQQARETNAPLNLRLAAVADEVARVDPDFARIVDEFVARLARNGAGLAAPKPGDPMPDFLLPDETGRLTSLRHALASGPAAISFHRGHWCPYCQVNLRALAQAAPRVAQLGARIVAITPETQTWSAELKTASQAPFLMLSDIDSSYALELELMFWVSDEKREAMFARGIDLARFQGGGAWMLPIPATFVVGRDGIIADRFVDPDYRRRMEVEDLVSALAAAS